MDYHYAPATAPPPNWATSGQHNEEMDINDLMGDIGGTSNSISYAPYPPQTNNYYAPFSSTSYSAGNQWSPPPPASSSFPLSTYSSLNGATSNTSIPPPMPAQSPPLPQGSPQPGHNQNEHSMAIDPSLISSNGNSGQQSSSSQSPPNGRPFYYHNPSSSTQLTMDQLFQLYRFNPQMFQQPGQQITPYAGPSSQGTLSPQALMNSSNSGAIQPSQFYAQPSPTSASPTNMTPTPTPGPDPTERRKQFQASITPMLAPNAFTGAGAVNTLAGRIHDYGLADVDASTRMDILCKIRDGAGNHYFRAWGENADAMDITREWLRAGFSSGSGSPLMETVMPLLQIIDRIPLSLEGLKASKLGRLVVKLTKEPPSPAVKDMASNLERRWRQMLAPPKSEDEDAKTKKRKSPETLPSKTAPPAKKLAVGTASSSKPQSSTSATKPRSSSNATPAKEVKSDTSFFSAPKPKPKLPSFKKAPVVSAKKEEVAQPSAVDPFQEALALMKGKRTGSPSGGGPVPSPTPTLPSMPNSSAVVPQPKSAKKRKSVTWAPDSELERVKLIERAVYDDDGESHGAHHNLRALDRGEGAALHLSEEDNAFEESIDYSEPLVVELPETLQNPPLGDLSEEKKTQEQRESSTLSALYMSPLHIPETPAELPFALSEEEIDKDMKQMTAGPEADAVFWAPTPEVPQPPLHQAGPVASVSQLLANLTGALQQTNTGNTANVDSASMATAANFMQTLPAEQIQALMAQFQNPVGGVASPIQQQQQGWPGWQNGEAENAGDQWFDGDHKGRGGRGRGRGRGGGAAGREGGGRPYRKKPCIFFMEGRCKYGDQCDFVHDMPPGS